MSRCDCPWNRTGTACRQLHKGFCVDRRNVDNPVNTCNEDDPALCVDGCNGRGKCMGGFCHCRGGERGCMMGAVRVESGLCAVC